MSAMLCCLCSALVIIDDDPDSLYVLKYPDKCVCKGCRNIHELPTEFDE